MKKEIKDHKQYNSKRRNNFKIAGIVLITFVVILFSLSIGLSACTNDVPDEEAEEADTVQTEADKKPTADKDKKPAKDDTDKDSTDKDKKPAKPSEKPNKEADKKPEESKKPEKTPAPDVKPDKPSKPTTPPAPKPTTPPAPKPTTPPAPKPTDPPAPKPTDPPAPKPTDPPAHVHTWEDVTEVRTTGYNEEKVLVEEAYDEQIAIGYHDVCNGCGASLSGMEEEDLMNHLAACGKGYHNEPIYQTIHHDAVYETVKTPITETVVVGRRCTSCGAYEAY